MGGTSQAPLTLAFYKNLFGYNEGRRSILDDGAGSLALEIFLHMFTSNYICSVGGTLSIIIQAVFMDG